MPVTIGGSGFFQAEVGHFPNTLTVTVCGAPLQNPQVQGASRQVTLRGGAKATINYGTTITGITSESAPGASGDVVVRLPDGQTATLSDAFDCFAPQPQLTSFAASPAGALVGEPVTFSWSISNPAGAELACTIETGEGSITMSACPDSGSATHTYAAAGSHSAILTVEAEGYEPVSAEARVEVTSKLPVAAPDQYTANNQEALTVSSPGVLANDTPFDATLSGPGTTDQGGSLNLATDGSFTYDAPAGFIGTDTFTYSLSNDFGTADALVTIQVGELPQAQSDSYTTSRGAELAVSAAEGVLANDSGAPTPAVTDWHEPANGTVTGQADGSFTYSPAPGFAGTDSFGYVISNGFGSASATVTVDVHDSPVANGDQYTTGLDEQLKIEAPGVLANDSGVPAPQAVVYDGPSANAGTVQLAADGSFSYTPPAGFTGADSFGYEAGNPAGNATATVQITVGSLPVAVGDETFAVFETPLDIPLAALLDNDSVNGASVSLVEPQSGEGGTLSLDETTITYAPPASFTGEDSFDYSLTNGLGESTATVLVTVRRAPALQDDSYVAVAGVTLSIPAPGVLDNDAGHPAPVAAAQAYVSTSLGGSVTIQPDGSFEYQPPTQPGTDTFDYEAFNVLGSRSATVTIEVRLTPVAVDDSYPVDVDVPLQAPAPGVLGNDMGVPPPTVTAATMTGTNGSTLQLNANGSFSYTPAAGFIGRDFFTYEISNNEGSDTGQVELVVGRPPVGTADSFTTTVSTEYSVQAPGVLGNDTVNGAVLTPLVSAATREGGQVDLLADGSFTYRPPPGFAGSDSFEYQLSNGLGSDTVSVTMTVAWAGPPSAVDDELDTPAGVPLELAAPGVRTNDAHNHAPVTGFEAVSANGGTVSVQPDGALSYAPPDGYTGRDSFTYTLGNALGDSQANVYVDVTATFQVVDDDFATDIATVVAGNVFDNDLGWPRWALHRTVAPAHADLTFNLNTGDFTYNPIAQFVGTDSFTYTVRDAGGAEMTGTVTVTVGRAPTAADDSYELEASSIPALLGSVLDNDDTQLATFSSQALTGDLGGDLSLQTDGQFSYVRQPGHEGTETFIYGLTNPHGTDSAEISIYVYRQAVAVADTVSTPMGEPVTINLLANDTGWPTPGLLSVDDSSTQGALSVDTAAGTVGYTPPTDFVGIDGFTYVISNGHGNAASAGVEIRVGSSPLAAPDTFSLLAGDSITLTRSDLLENDTFLGEPAFSTDTGALQGSLSASGSNLTYTPPPGFMGVDQFSYTLSNALGDSTATVTLEVHGGPLTATDNYATGLNVPLVVAQPMGVLANDSGYPLPAATPQETTNATGALSLAADGSFGFTPANGYVGVTEFTYEATNPVGTATGTLRITVGSAPTAANDDAGTVLGNVPGVLYAGAEPFSPLANDSGDALMLASVDSTASLGTATLLPDGTIRYLPPAGYTGPDSFSYTAENGIGASTGTVSVNVSGMIWFVAADAAAGGDGRLDTPFSTTAQLPALSAGDVVLFHEGSYSGAPELAPGVRLIGQGATGDLAALTGLTWTAGVTMPELLGPADGQVSLALGSGSLVVSTDNHLHGLSISGTAADEPLLKGASFVSLTATGVELAAVGRDAISLANGTVDATFDSVTSSGGTSAVLLQHLGGSFRIAGGALTTSGNSVVSERCLWVRAHEPLTLSVALEDLALEDCAYGIDVDTRGNATVQLDLQRLEAEVTGGAINLYATDTSVLDIRLGNSDLNNTVAANTAVGFWALSEDYARLRAMITGSTFSGSSTAVYATAREGDGASVDLTLRNSSLAAAGDWPLAGLWVAAGNGTPGELTRVCMDVTDNQFTAEPGAWADIAVEQYSGNLLQVSGFPGGDNAALRTYLSTNNGLASTDVTTTTPALNAPCQTPIIPGG